MTKEIAEALPDQRRRIVWVSRQRPHARNLRKGRYSQPGLYYFLATAVANRRTIFARHETASVVLNAIRWLDTSQRFTIDAAVVMPDHVHFAGQLRESALSNVMHTLKSYTANRLAGLGVDTPIWQPGFHDHALRDDEDYLVRIQYLLNNPVRAGLVERIEDYPFIIIPVWW